MGRFSLLLMLLGVVYLFGCSEQVSSLRSVSSVPASGDQEEEEEGAEARSLEAEGLLLGQGWQEAFSHGVIVGSIPRFTRLGWLDASDVAAIVPLGEALFLTTSAGLVRLHGGELSRHYTREDGLRHHHLGAALLWDGMVWFGVDREGCQRVTRAGEILECPSGLEGEAVAAWFGEGTGLEVLTWRGRRYALEDGRFRLLEQHEAPFTSQVLRCDGVRWRATSRGLISLDGGGREAIAFDQVSCASGVLLGRRGARLFQRSAEGWEDLEVPGRLQVITEGGPLRVSTTTGIYEKERAGWRLVLESPGEVDWIWGGEEEILFGGDWGLASATISDNQWVMAPVMGEAWSGAGANDVSALTEIDGHVVVGFFREGVSISSGSGWRHVGFPQGMPSEEVNVLAAYHGSVLAGTSRGLVEISLEGEVLQVWKRGGGARGLPCDHVNTLLVEGGDAWLGTSCGVGELSLETGEIKGWASTPEGLPHRITYSLARWEGRLIAGTNDGLGILEEGAWRRLRAHPETYRDNWVTALEVHEGTLYVGTYSHGLYRTDDLLRFEDLGGPEYINLNALQSTPEGLWVGGLDEGAWLVRGGDVLALPASCSPGRDLTAFASGEGLLLASRQGVWRALPDCEGMSVQGKSTVAPLVALASKAAWAAGASLSAKR